jgi:uncharacterized membrane protein YhaH (DUF805 family)
MNRTLAQNLALGFGVVFLVVGILGFIPGITTNYDDLEFAGKDSGAELLGIFQVSILHNIAHLLFAVGILAARTHELARTYLLGGAIVYIVLFIYGLFVGGGDDANFIPMNGADDVLHLLLAIAFIGAYFVTGRERPAATVSP